MGFLRLSILLGVERIVIRFFVPKMCKVTGRTYQ